MSIMKTWTSPRSYIIGMTGHQAAALYRSDMVRLKKAYDEHVARLQREA